MASSKFNILAAADRKIARAFIVGDVSHSEAKGAKFGDVFESASARDAGNARGGLAVERP